MTYSKKIGTETKCGYCGKPFIIKKGQYRYCSKECASKRNREAGCSTKQKTKYRIVCVICKKVFESTNYQKTCSTQCYDKYKRLPRETKKELHENVINMSQMECPWKTGRIEFNPFFDPCWG